MFLHRGPRRWVKLTGNYDDCHKKEKKKKQSNKFAKHLLISAIKTMRLPGGTVIHQAGRATSDHQMVMFNYPLKVKAGVEMSTDEGSTLSLVESGHL